jgi:hypothetical protein
MPFVTRSQGHPEFSPERPPSSGRLPVLPSTGSDASESPARGSNSRRPDERFPAIPAG